LKYICFGSCVAALHNINVTGFEWKCVWDV